VGTCSWTDPTLTRETSFYPRVTMSAEQTHALFSSCYADFDVRDGHQLASMVAQPLE
jgi:hypothetical protein